MVAQRSRVREVGLADGVALAREGRTVIDVREPAEWEAGHVAGATLLPLGELSDRVRASVPDLATPLLVHCEVGRRSALAAELLAGLGYRDVINLRASISGWDAAGGAWEAGVAARYARQALVPEIGAAGQQRLAESRVLIVGAGGLGSPAALYLAAAGIGTIVLVDDDVVDESNLHRQVLHSTDRIGTPKVASAERTLRALNPEVRVVVHRERLVGANADRLLAGADVVIDGTDSLDTRYVINDAAMRLGLPVVHGSVHRWDGQVTVLGAGGPCYRCLHPEPPPAELAPDCAVAGVVGVVPGLVGLLQATEALKLLLGVGRSLVGRVLLVDALAATVDELRVERDAACPACGDGSG